MAKNYAYFHIIVADSRARATVGGLKPSEPTTPTQTLQKSL